MKLINIILKIYFIINLLFQNIRCDSNIKISVIVYIFNSELYLDRCIESLFNQTLRDIEFLFIDDGSNDNSLNILKYYQNIDDRVKIYHNTEEKGLSFSVNIGIKNASGEFISFMKSDDVIIKEYFERLYNYTKYNDIIIINPFERNKNISVKYTKSENLKYIPSNVYSSIFRKNFLDKNNIHFTNLKECYKYKPRIFKLPHESINYYKENERLVYNYEKEFLKNEYENYNRIKSYKNNVRNNTYI